MIRYLLPFVRSITKEEKENKNGCLEAIGITLIGGLPAVTDVTTRLEQTINVKIPMTLHSVEYLEVLVEKAVCQSIREFLDHIFKPLESNDWINTIADSRREFSSSY